MNDTTLLLIVGFLVAFYAGYVVGAWAVNRKLQDMQDFIDDIAAEAKKEEADAKETHDRGAG